MLYIETGFKDDAVRAKLLEVPSVTDEQVMEKDYWTMSTEVEHQIRWARLAGKGLPGYISYICLSDQ